MMGIATVLIGLHPGRQPIGVAAPILLVVLRFVQGLAVGGEWAGATLLVAEYAPQGKRGLFGVLSAARPLRRLRPGQRHVPAHQPDTRGQVRGLHHHRLAGAVHPQRSAGHRGPVGPAEHRGDPGLQERRQGSPIPATKLPVLESVKRQPREILLAGGSLTLLFAFFYMGTAYLTSYATSPTGMRLSRVEVLSTGMVASVFVAAATLASGVLSDRFGRKKVIATSCILAVPWSLGAVPDPQREHRLRLWTRPHRHPGDLRHRLRPRRGTAAGTLRDPLPLHRRRHGLQPGRRRRRRHRPARGGTAGRHDPGRGPSGSCSPGSACSVCSAPWPCPTAKSRRWRTATSTPPRSTWTTRHLSSPSPGPSGSEPGHSKLAGPGFGWSAVGGAGLPAKPATPLYGMSPSRRAADTASSRLCADNLAIAFCR